MHSYVPTAIEAGLTSVAVLGQHSMDVCTVI